MVAVDLPNGDTIFFSSGTTTGPGGSWIPETNNVSNFTGSHAEGHAAAYMVENELTELTITINHQGGPCNNCLSQLPDLMPADTVLTVNYVDKNGRPKTKIIRGRKND